MIKEYDRVIGKSKEKTVIGIAVDIHTVRGKNKRKVIAIEEDETNEVHLFFESEVTPESDQ